MKTVRIISKIAGTALIALTLIIISGLTVFADEGIIEPDWSKSVKVYFTVTKDSEFVTANGNAIALDYIEVPYFDLANYGMQDLYYNPDCYTGGNKGSQSAGTQATAEGNVTVLHLFIYATEVYKCGLSPSEAGKGYLAENNWPYFNVFDRFPGSAFVNFWDFGSDIVYYVNYEYPLAYVGWGATCDQIALTNGDVVTARHDNGSGGEETTGTFYHFGMSAEITRRVMSGNFTPLTLCKTGKTADYSGTGHTTAGEGHTVSVVSRIGGEALVTGTTNSYGDVRLDTSSLSDGDYFVISDTFDPAVLILTIYGGADPGPTPGPGPTPTPDPAADLEQAKTAAKAELSAYKDPSLYRDAQKAELTKAITKGEAAIDAAADADGVKAALDAAKAEIDVIKTDAEMKKLVESLL